jgi:hypothetical protein
VRFAKANFKNEKLFRLVGVDSGGGTPDPIPNSEVKPASGDGTAQFAVWKSSTTPTFFSKGVC